MPVSGSMDLGIIQQVFTNPGGGRNSGSIRLDIGTSCRGLFARPTRGQDADIVEPTVPTTSRAESRASVASASR